MESDIIDATALQVGYLMKASRAADLSQRGFLPSQQESASVVCTPLDQAGTPSTWPPVHVVLHKSSDFLRWSTDEPQALFYDDPIPQLRALPQADGCCASKRADDVTGRTPVGGCESPQQAVVVDNLDNVAVLHDRVATLQRLQSLPEVSLQLLRDKYEKNPTSLSPRGTIAAATATATRHHQQPVRMWREAFGVLQTTLGNCVPSCATLSTAPDGPTAPRCEAQRSVITPECDKGALLQHWASRVRVPVWVEVTAATATQPAALMATLVSAGLEPPIILKPAVACGVEEAHRHIIVATWEAIRTVGKLPVSYPMVAQEYVQHGGCVHKVYCIGGGFGVRSDRQCVQVPDVASASLRDKLAKEAIVVDSLQEKNLMTGIDAVLQQCFFRRQHDTLSAGLCSSAASPQCAASSVLCVPNDSGGLVDHLVALACCAVGKVLGVSLLGLDIVVEVTSGDHVVLDINYFPSYKGVAGAADQFNAWLASLRTTCGCMQRANIF